MNPEERDQNLTENAFIHAHELLSAKFRRQLSCKYSVMMGENAQSAISVQTENSIDQISSSQFKYRRASTKNNYKTKDPQLISPKTEKKLPLIAEYPQKYSSPAPKISITHIHPLTFNLHSPLCYMVRCMRWNTAKIKMLPNLTKAASLKEDLASNNANTSLCLL